jgi:hypothetical protein
MQGFLKLCVCVCVCVCVFTGDSWGPGNCGEWEDQGPTALPWKEAEEGGQGTLIKQGSLQESRQDKGKQNGKFSIYPCG